MSKKIFLIPTYLDSSNTRSFIAPMVVDIISHLDYYLVENVRTARRFISSLQTGVDISNLRFEVLDKRSDATAVQNLLNEFPADCDIGLMSEAGLPGLADPGNLAVSWAHRNNAQVVPLPGASSIQMALTASGFNGQNFTFHGYLPIDGAQRIRRIKELETEAARDGYTQLFMETPFRNNQLLEALLNELRPQTLLGIAAGISAPNEMIKTLKVLDWKKSPPDLHKIPTVFSLGTFPH